MAVSIEVGPFVTFIDGTQAPGNQFLDDTFPGLATDPATGATYFAARDGTVRRLGADRETLETVATVGGIPGSVSITPDGLHLYVSQSEVTDIQDAGTFDENAGIVVHRVEIATGAVTDVTFRGERSERGSADVAVSSTGLAFFTTDYAGSGRNPLRRIDDADLTISELFYPTTPGGEVTDGSWLTASEDGRHILLLERGISSDPTAIYDAATDSFIALTDKFEAGGSGPSVGDGDISSAAGLVFALTYGFQIFDFDFELVADLRSLFVRDAAFSDDGSRIFALSGDATLRVIDTADWSAGPELDLAAALDRPGLRLRGVDEATTDARLLLDTGTIFRNEGMFAADLPRILAATFGDDGANEIAGTGAADDIVGDSGHDTLSGRGGNDMLVGNDGNDTLFGGGLTDSLFGGIGDDTLDGGDGVDRLFGGDGDDLLAGGDGLDVMFGGEGADLFAFGTDDRTDYVRDFELGLDRVDARALGAIDFADLAITDIDGWVEVRFDGPEGARVLWLRVEGGFGAENFSRQDFVLEGDDPDAPWPPDGVIVGTEGSDTLTGTAGGETMFGLGGDDAIGGLEGDDTIDGGSGDDLLVGNEGNDEISGGTGDDTLAGLEDDDILLGGDGDDILDGHTGNDMLSGENGDDILIGAEDNDTLDGGAGSDWLLGDQGDDLLIGGGLADTLEGGTGNDTLFGGQSVDLLYGGDGNDILWGGDRLDQMWGGAGADLFVFGTDDRTDYVRDFELGIDRVSVGHLGPVAFAALDIRDEGSWVAVTLGGASLYLRGDDLTAAALGEADFDLAGSISFA